MDRIAEKIEFGECWVWIAGRARDGYGRIQMEGKNRYAHRALYEEVVGVVPEGLELDHLCQNTSCVNPDHLEPVTSSENMRRSLTKWRERTHCLHGHSLGDAYLVKKGKQRRCRQCAREWNAQQYAKRRSS